SAAEYSTCAAVSGAIKCWGDSRYFQLGRSGQGVNTLMTVLESMTGVTDIALSSKMGCAVKDGGAWCWGDYYGDPRPAASLNKNVTTIDIKENSQEVCVTQGET